MSSVEVCGNQYVIPDDYSVETINTNEIYINGKKIEVNYLYKVTKYEDIGGVSIETTLFDDIYIFEYGGFSYLAIRHVCDDGKVIKKIEKAPCFSGKIVDVARLLKTVEGC